MDQSSLFLITVAAKRALKTESAAVSAAGGQRAGTARRCDYDIFAPQADVAELVDAHGSGPCRGNPVEVRVLSSALGLISGPM